MGLVDTHCHLTYGELEAKIPEGAWQRAREAGVERAIVIGIDAASSPRMLEVRRGSTTTSDAAVGIHPNEVGEAAPGDMARDHLSGRASQGGGDRRKRLGRLLGSCTASACSSSYLERHIELAMRDGSCLSSSTSVPPIRWPPRSSNRTCQLDGLRGVIHCFGCAGHEADPFIDWGWPISFSGILTYTAAPGTLGRPLAVRR